MRRYENKSTLMTSNRPIEEWGKLLNDVPAATAILDRFLPHAEIIAMKGRSYRLRHGGRSEGLAEEQNSESAPSGLGKKKVTVRRHRLTVREAGMARWQGETTIISIPPNPTTPHPQRES
jgi:hypothetical protein